MTSPTRPPTSVTVVGHPFGPLGRSRAARCIFGSLQAARQPTRLIDVWGHSTPEPAHRDTLVPHLTKEFGDINVFALNGDEIERALDNLGGLRPGARNIISPAWELPRFPDIWAEQVARFDEVWADSAFMASSIGRAVSIPVIHLPMGTEVKLSHLRTRRYFGIPEAAYAFLFFFDLRSYVARKNPQAVIAAFRKLLQRRPWAQACLVIKLHGSAADPDALVELQRSVADIGTRVVMIDAVLSEDDAQNLARVCDAFVSLHRAEGYGLGLAEAMALGKPVVGTAYSGNMDFMTPDVSRLVDFELVPVPPAAYPHWEDQAWAEPDVDQAAEHMVGLYDDPDAGRALGRRAAAHMQAHFSFRAAGLRYRERIETFARPDA